MDTQGRVEFPAGTKDGGDPAERLGVLALVVEPLVDRKFLLLVA